MHPQLSWIEQQPSKLSVIGSNPIGCTKITDMKEYFDEREAFVRIAKARLKPLYPFKPQRAAVAAKMWRKWYERKNQV